VYIGKLSMAEQVRHSESVKNAGFNMDATFILGGQISGQRPWSVNAQMSGYAILT